MSLKNFKLILFRYFIALLWYCFFGSGTLTAQNWIITGTVSSGDAPLVAASVYATPADTTAPILQFVSTDATGSFRLEIEDRFQVVRLHVNYLGYQKYSIKVNRETPQPLAIVLEVADNTISEMVVAEDRLAITTPGDTIVYDVDQFRDSTERRVADLLQKLPGVEVDENGEISVQGRPIKKMLIEGTDMFGRQYTMGSENLPADMIESIEVIDHYQENQILRDLNRTEDLVINLKLREDAKNELSATGTFTSGYGQEAKIALEATGFLISKRVKHLLVTNNGNTGTQYGLGEIQATYNFDRSDNFEQQDGEFPVFVRPITANSLNFRREFMDNARSGFGTYRGYLQPNPNWEIQCNLSAAGNSDSQLNQQGTRFAFEENTYTTNQDRRVRFDNRFADVETKTNYVSNNQNHRIDAYLRYRYDTHAGSEFGLLRSDGETQILNSHVNTDGQTLRGAVRYSWRLSSQHALLLTAKASHYKSQETLSTDYPELRDFFGISIAEAEIAQQIDPTDNHRSVRLNYLTRLGSWTVRAGSFLLQRDLNYHLSLDSLRAGSGETDNTFEYRNNTIRSTTLNNYVEANRSFKKDWRLKLRGGFTAAHFQDRTDRISFDPTETPSIYLRLDKQLTPKIKGYLSYGYARNLPDEQLPIDNLTGPLSYRRQQFLDRATGGHRIRFYLAGLDPLKARSWHLRASASLGGHQWQQAFDFVDNIIVTRPIFVTGAENYRLDGKYEQFLDPILTNLELAPFASYSIRPVAFENRRERSQTQTIGLRSELAHRSNDRWLVKLRGRVSHTRFEGRTATTNEFTVFNLEPEIILNWLDMRWFGILYHTRGVGAGSKFAFWGSKFRIRREVMLGKMPSSLQLDVNNFLNVRRYEQLLNDDFFVFTNSVEAIAPFVTLGIDFEF